MSVNMQEINSKPWIMGRIMEGAKNKMYQFALRLTADKREIKDFPKLPSATSFIRKTLYATHYLNMGGKISGFPPRGLMRRKEKLSKRS